MIDRLQLAQLGRTMRLAQQAYFKRRDTGLLETAKAAEKEFDAAIDEVLNPTLFGPADADEATPRTSAQSDHG
jgi:hypothetical protein